MPRCTQAFSLLSALSQHSAQRSRALAIVRGRRESPDLAAYLALLVDPLLAVARPVDDLVRVRARWVRC